ncbi:MAG TPA: hypothetical protein VF587_04105 [Solirubrobacteraceae bacterium]|jgi:hypothetical protein
MRRFTAKLVILATVALTAVALMAVPAAGHWTEIFHGDDHGTNDHSHFNISDHECDGNRVYGNAYDASGYRGPAYDEDGCGGTYRHLDGLNYSSYRICEEGVSCTAFRGT